MFLAGEVVLVRTHFAEHAHGLAVVRVGQAVPRHMIDQLAVAVADTGARVDHVRRVGHRLHAARDDNGGRAGLDQVVTQHDGLHARTADLVDGRATHADGQACTQGCLARRGLAEVGGQHAAHDDFADVRGRDARLLQGCANSCCTQRRGRHAGELAEERANGCALGTGDDNTDVRHGDLRKYLMGQGCPVNSLRIIAVPSQPGQTTLTCDSGAALPTFSCVSVVPISAPWRVMRVRGHALTGSQRRMAG